MSKSEFPPIARHKDIEQIILDFLFRSPNNTADPSEVFAEVRSKYPYPNLQIDDIMIREVLWSGLIETLKVEFTSKLTLKARTPEEIREAEEAP